MQPKIPIALGAGAIAAIVFASATTGPAALRIVLLVLVTLPVALAGFAYNVRTAALAAAVATLMIGGLVSLPLGALFALTTVIPATALVHLALLHREAASGETHWYPPGRIVVAAALMGGCIAGAGLVLATLPAGQVPAEEGSSQLPADQHPADQAGLGKLRGAVTDAVRRAARLGFAGMPGGPPLSEADIAKLAGIMLDLLPGLSAAVWMGSVLFCVWLAAHVALASGQLARPWPDLGLLAFPAGTSLLLAASLAAAFWLDGLARLVALGFAGALYTAYVLLGLAIVHHVSRTFAWRNPALSGLYVLLIVMTQPASLMLAMLALIDSFKPLRPQPGTPPPASV